MTLMNLLNHQSGTTFSAPDGAVTIAAIKNARDLGFLMEGDR